MDNILEAIVSSQRSSLSYRREHEESLDVQVIDDVKIIPPRMVFSDAYDGKMFNKTLTIINCGKYSAFVRLLPPSSKSFKMKPVPKGVYLPSGLSLSRKIFYTHTSPLALPRACLFIYINGKPIIYQIEVVNELRANLLDFWQNHSDKTYGTLETAAVLINEFKKLLMVSFLNSPFISLKPKIVDFGEIDVGNASKQMPIELKNSGHKVALFSVDLGRNDLELIVVPMKGIVEPNKSVQITVEVLGSQLGCFNKEFWIKTEPPQRVNICGIFIPATLVIEYPLMSFSIKMVDFPVTYYGAEVIRSLVIQNSSSSDSMFCTVAECGNDFDYLNVVRETNDNLKCFYIKPKEGRLNAQQKFILKYSFAPKRMKYIKQRHRMAFIRVMRVNYRDGFIVEKDIEVKTFPAAMDIGQYSISSLQSLKEFDAEVIPESHFIRICLYGETEDASVKLTPESFRLNYLKTHETYSYELNIKNNSKFLPISVNYNKEACIEINPKQVLLGPSCSVEVAFTIKPSKIGGSFHNIVFDLVYHSGGKYYKVGAAHLPIQYYANATTSKIKPKFNMGITPKITNEVGFLVDDIRFNTNIEKPRQAIVDKNFKSFNKDNADLVAFPNDRPKSLRPWRNTVPSRTIFANIPRRLTEVDKDYTLNTAEFEQRRLARNVYSTYLQSATKAKQLKSLQINKNPDYDVTNEKHLLLKDVRHEKLIKHRSTYLSVHIPLPPEKLTKVIVTPKYMQLGKIAPYTLCTDAFTIQNRNDFSINVSIKALNNSIVIKEKKRMTIGPNKVKDIYFDCYSHGLGKYYVPVFIIINDCHIFDATVFARVVPTTVKCAHKEITIDPKTNECIFELYNPVNCDIGFAFDGQDPNFHIVPESGRIPARKAIFCRIVFVPQNHAAFKTEMFLISESGAKQILKVSLENKKASVCFHTDLVKFDNIPLNITVRKEIVMRNFSDYKITYRISNPNPLEEIVVKPIDGNINPKSDVHFQVIAHFNNVVNFNCAVRFILQDTYTYVINIAGNVVFPKIKLEPKYIQVDKIVSGAFLRRVFRITNISAGQNYISFPFRDMPEFCITDLDKNITNEVIALEPNESRELFVVFQPTEPIAYSIYLPYIMNGVIGPPILNDPKSAVPMTYFQKSTSKNKIPSSIPDKLPTISIRCAGGAPWLNFSSLHIHLFSFTNKTREDFTITNISATEQQISIPLIDKKYPLCLESEETSSCEINQYLKVSINPEQTVTIKIVFNPSEYGQYDLELPIFVEKYFEKCPFNFLKISASHPVPNITCDDNNLYFQTIWVKEKVDRKITLNLATHKEHCTIITEVVHEALSVKLLKKIALTQFEVKAYFLVTFDPKEECCVDAVITFTCTCCSESSCNVFIKASADNTTFVSYKSLLIHRATQLSMESISTFPYFPKSTNHSFYAVKMRNITKILEKWLFSQGFFFKNFYKIPYGISRFPVEMPLTAKKKFFSKKTIPTLPLMQLLINLVGISIVKLIDGGNASPSYDDIDDMEVTVHVYTVYQNIISFLRSQLVFVPWLQPEHLLPYHRYIEFKKKYGNAENQPKEELLAEEDFFLFSKQCWVDLLLRIYKMFVFKRILNPSTKIKSKLPQNPVVYQDEFTEYFYEHLIEVENRSEDEAKLLLWLEFHFEKQKFVLWDTENLKNPRKIRSFENHLWDSLPFATLMVAYCPYMINELKNFFPDYQNKEQIFHNACVISNVWKRINLSFDLHPNNIVNPVAIEMILLVSYLYDVLPTYYPTETITFEASLGDTVVSEITLRNQGDVPISYATSFFLNDSDTFHIDPKTIIIPPMKEKRLKVSYKARSVLKKTAVLVLSGETPGYKYSKSMVVTLVGNPRIHHFSEEYNLSINTFQKVRKKLSVSSPFEIAYEANVYLYRGENSSTPESISDLTSLSSIVNEKVPRQAMFDPISIFNENGETVLDITLCYVVVGVFSYYLFFLNQEVGDFCIKITLESILNEEETIDLEVNLPSYFDPLSSCTCQSCTCQKGIMNLHCPQIFSISIPCQNSQLFNGLRLMLETCCDEDEFSFWNSLLDYPKGLHVLRYYYMENSFVKKLLILQNVLSPTVTYTMDDERHKFIGPKKITIEHVSTNEVYNLGVHWKAMELPQKDLLILRAEHGQEIRQYRLIFKKPIGMAKSVESIKLEEAENSDRVKHT